MWGCLDKWIYEREREKESKLQRGLKEVEFRALYIEKEKQRR